MLKLTTDKHEASHSLCDSWPSCYVHIFRHDLLRYISYELNLFLHVLHVYDYWEASDHNMMRMFVFYLVGIRQLRSVVIFTLDY